MSGRRAGPTRRRMAVVTALAVVAMARGVGAHPAGVDSVNRYIGVSCDGRGRIHIAYLLELAELPSAAEVTQLDADGDGTVTPGEQRAYLDKKLLPIVASWTVEIERVRVEPRVAGSSLEVLEGERGMPTLRIAADVDVPAPGEGAQTAGAVHVYVRDTAFADRPGFREIAGSDSPTARLVAGPAEPKEGALAYAGPDGVHPPRMDEAQLVFRPATRESATPSSAAPGPVTGERARSWPRSAAAATALVALVAVGALAALRARRLKASRR